jgi:hypothetical protein
LLGSVAERVVRAARCPVLTVRESRAAEKVPAPEAAAVPMPACRKTGRCRPEADGTECRHAA